MTVAVRTDAQRPALDRGGRLALLVRLLGIAQTAAAAEVGQVPATPTNLIHLASAVKRAIELQAYMGMWSRLGVAGSADVAELHVSARRGLHADEPDVVLSYDFSKTPVAWAKVRMRRPDGCGGGVVLVADAEAGAADLVDEP